MKRIMIAGTNSGCGKTTFTMGLIKALMLRGYDISPFKCGPDYIDPMFHEKIVGAKARNLDSVFCDEATICNLINKYSKDFSVIEGVMGFYDGVMGKGSSDEVSRLTNTPVILVVDAKGMSESMGAIVSGFVKYKPNNIKGIVFNRLPESLINMAKEICEKSGVKYYGRLLFDKAYSLESRHLGLVTASEVSNLKEKVEAIASMIEANVMIDEIIQDAVDSELNVTESENFIVSNRPNIAVASDEAFCFIYNDNIDYLREAGCEITYFSPIRDKGVPDDVDGIILPGGYPELYLDELSSNKDMLKSIKELVGKVPTIAECGGFMYLHDTIKLDKSYDMAGVIKGTVTKKERLVRFGYVSMENKNGEKVTAHEFHYFDSDNNGSDLEITKLSNGFKYKSVHMDSKMYAGFPHIYFYGNRDMANTFITRCSEHKKTREV